MIVFRPGVFCDDMEKTNAMVKELLWEDEVVLWTFEYYCYGFKANPHDNALYRSYYNEDVSFFPSSELLVSPVVNLAYLVRFDVAVPP